MFGVWVTVNTCVRGDVFIRCRGTPPCSKECASQKSFGDGIEELIIKGWFITASCTKKSDVFLFGKEIWKTIRRLSDASDWTPIIASFEYLGFDICSDLS